MTGSVELTTTPSGQFCKPEDCVKATVPRPPMQTSPRRRPASSPPMDVAAHIDQAFAVARLSKPKCAARRHPRRSHRQVWRREPETLGCIALCIGWELQWTSGFRVFVYQVFEFRQAHCGETLRLIRRRRIGEGGGKRGAARNERAWCAAVGAPVGPRRVSQTLTGRGRRAEWPSRARGRVERTCGRHRRAETSGDVTGEQMAVRIVEDVERGAGSRIDFEQMRLPVGDDEVEGRHADEAQGRPDAATQRSARLAESDASIVRHRYRAAEAKGMFGSMARSIAASSARCAAVGREHAADRQPLAGELLLEIASRSRCNAVTDRRGCGGRRCRRCAWSASRPPGRREASVCVSGCGMFSLSSVAKKVAGSLLAAYRLPASQPSSRKRLGESRDEPRLVLEAGTEDEPDRRARAAVRERIECGDERTWYGSPSAWRHRRRENPQPLRAYRDRRRHRRPAAQSQRAGRTARAPARRMQRSGPIGPRTR